MFPAQKFFDLKSFDHRDLFPQDADVWKALDRLPQYLGAFFRKSWPLYHVSKQIDRPLVIYNREVREDLEVITNGEKGSVQVKMQGQVLKEAAVILPGAFLFDDKIIIGPGTVVEPGALIKGPTVIGRDCEIRQGAYVRGNCLVGNKCVIGHATEIKGSIMLDGAKAAHFAYVGDSILGNAVNLGAGTRLANLRMIPGSIVITHERKRYKTGRRKLGAVIGDGTETGCNSVTSPGTLLGPSSIVYAGLTVPAGYYPNKTLFTPAKGSLQIHSMES